MDTEIAYKWANFDFEITLKALAFADNLKLGDADATVAAAEKYLTFLRDQPRREASSVPATIAAS